MPHLQVQRTGQAASIKPARQCVHKHTLHRAGQLEAGTGFPGHKLQHVQTGEGTQVQG